MAVANKKEYVISIFSISDIVTADHLSPIPNFKRHVPSPGLFTQTNANTATVSSNYQHSFSFNDPNHNQVQRSSHSGTNLPPSTLQRNHLPGRSSLSPQRNSLPGTWSSTPQRNSLSGTSSSTPPQRNSLPGTSSSTISRAVPTNGQNFNELV